VTWFQTESWCRNYCIKIGESCLEGNPLGCDSLSKQMKQDMRPIFTNRSCPTTHQDCDGHRQLVVFQRILFICLLNLLANARNWGCYFEDLFSVPASVHDFISKFCKLAAVLQSLDKFICSMRLTMKRRLGIQIHIVIIILQDIIETIGWQVMNLLVSRYYLSSTLSEKYGFMHTI
jgi:hypothetical protein